MLHHNKRQRTHWACRQYGHTGGTWGWLGVERWQLCPRDTSRSANCHRPAAVGHCISLCVKCCRMVDSVLSLSCSQYSWHGWDDNACLGVRNTCSKGAWPNSLDRRPPWYCVVSPLLQTNNVMVLFYWHELGLIWFRWLNVWNSRNRNFDKIL